MNDPPAKPAIYKTVIDWDKSRWIEATPVNDSSNTNPSGLEEPLNLPEGFVLEPRQPKEEWKPKSAVRVEEKGHFKKAYKQELVEFKAEARFIDLYRLGVQYFIVAVVTAGLIITLRDRKTG